MGITMKRVAALAAGLILAAGVAACNEDKDSNADGGNTEQEQSSPAEDDGKGGEDEGGAPGESGDTMTLSGTVTAGTEPGCTLLEHKGETYQLTGEKAEKLKADTKIEVTGTVSKNQMSTCMEGTPFTVESVSQQ